MVRKGKGQRLATISGFFTLLALLCLSLISSPSLAQTAQPQAETAAGARLLWRDARTEQALAVADRLCIAGDQSACGLQASILVDKDNFTADEIRQVRRLATQSCGANDPMGCTALADVLARGIGVAINLPQAARLFEQACDAGEVRGCIMLARLHFAYPHVFPGQIATVSKRLETQCQQGSAIACVEVIAYANERVLSNPSDGLLRRACEEGSGDACSSVAISLIYGWYQLKQAPPAVDQATAFAAVDRSCRFGNQVDCERLGYFYLRGIGVRQSQEQAFAAFQRSVESSELNRRYRREMSDVAFAIFELARRDCTAGVALSCEATAHAVLDGMWMIERQNNGFEFTPDYGYRDRRQARGDAVRLLGIACEASSATACSSLGRLESGPARIAAYDRACSFDSTVGCHRWAMALIGPNWTGSDPDKGMQWLETACRNQTVYKPIDNACALVAFAKRTKPGATEADLVEARRMFAAHCDLAMPKVRSERTDACFGLLIMASLGEGGPVDHALALELQGNSRTSTLEARFIERRICDLGLEQVLDDRTACNAAGQALTGRTDAFATDWPSEPKAAYDYFVLGCARGDKSACEFAGDYHSQSPLFANADGSRIQPADPVRELDFQRRACDPANLWDEGTCHVLVTMLRGPMAAYAQPGEIDAIETARAAAIDAIQQRRNALSPEELAANDAATQTAVLAITEALAIKDGDIKLARRLWRPAPR